MLKRQLTITRTHPRSMHRGRGFTLLEVLVALVVMTVGMLGVAVLYVEGLRMNRTSIHRTLAVALAADMADRIRSNDQAPAGYAGAGPGADNSCVNGGAACSPVAQAQDDWFWWTRDVSDHLPLGTEANIEVVGVGNMNRYEISISWPETGQPGPASYMLPIQL